jgi:6-phosphogluconate dehydrogenase (decarboxylating)
MKIDEALTKLHSSFSNDTISSGSAEMFAQTVNTLIFWLLVDDGDEQCKVNTLKKILKADDWVVDGEEIS